MLPILSNNIETKTLYRPVGAKELELMALPNL